MSTSSANIPPIPHDNHYFLPSPTTDTSIMSAPVEGEGSHTLQDTTTTAVTIQHVVQALRQAHYTNEKCKETLKVLKIIGAHNAKRGTKQKLIAIKMLQRSLTVAEMEHVLRTTQDSASPPPAFFNSLRSTTVRLRRSDNNAEEFDFVRGDIPVVEGDTVLIGEPATENCEAPTSVRETRSPAFEASEFCRLLHVFADSRMTAAPQKLMECMTRAEMDQQHEDPWCESVACLFNDPNFQPEATTALAGGVTRSDISDIDPSLCPHVRDGGLLKRKFAQFKSQYGNRLARYEASGQGDPEAFAAFADGLSYIMYAYCFLKLHPVLQPFATRALRSDAQREEGVGGGVSPYGFGGNTVSRSTTLRRGVRDVNVIGMDGLVSATLSCERCSWRCLKLTQDIQPQLWRQLQKQWICSAKLSARKIDVYFEVFSES